MTTQGTENYNNHPFVGKVNNTNFAFAHNGVLHNDEELRESKNLHLKTKLSHISAINLIRVCMIMTILTTSKTCLELTQILNEKGVTFISKKEAIDTTTPTVKFMLTIFESVAELEREYILQRQKEGIEIAKTQGKYLGRKPKAYPEFDLIVSKWKNCEISATKACKRLGMSPSTFYRRLKFKL